MRTAANGITHSRKDDTTAPGSQPSAALSDKAGSLSLARQARLRPWQVTWEVTRISEFNPGHLRAHKRYRGDLGELSTAESFHLIDEVAALRVPWLALVGGDPLARLDLMPILRYAARRAVRTSVTLLPTSLVTPETISELKECGVMRIAFWIHASNAAAHDAFVRRREAFRQTLDAIALCHESEIPVQINTTIARHNFRDLEPLIELLMRFDVVLWSVFFLVPAGEEQAAELLNAVEHEEVFARLYAASRRAAFQIKTTEGQHYQRYLLQQRVRESRGRLSEAEALNAFAKPDDRAGFVFINHAGEVYPSRFLPLSAGNVTVQPLAKICGESPLFVSFRDGSILKGKCGRCPAVKVCGGSRARAYAMTKDLYAEEPCCAYEPK